MSNFIEKISKAIFSTRAAGIYLLALAGSIAWATFVENDFGTSAAQKVIFRARWFELLLILFGICIAVNIIRFQLIQQKKWASLLFHTSILVIILGSGITRYFGFEGMMHIRQGEKVNHIISSESFINLKLKENNQVYSISDPILVSSFGKNKFERKYQVGDKIFNLKLLEVIPNPTETMVETNEGKPIIKIVFGGAQGREEYFLQENERKNFNGINFNFSYDYFPNAFNIQYSEKGLVFKTSVPVVQTVMATQKSDTIPSGDFKPLMLRSLYQYNGSSFVFGEFQKDVKIELISSDKKIKNESMVALRMELSSMVEKENFIIVGRKGEEGKPIELKLNNTPFSIDYGSKEVSIPFAIQLNKFKMERYPGTNNASSYESEVRLLDPAKGINQEHRIYMNNILDYGGYRFFQSSFDPDELGTILSVNHDFWGTWVSYIGYGLLTLGLIMIFVVNNSRFTYLRERLKDLNSNIILIVTSIVFFSMASGISQSPILPKVISKEHAEKFSKIVVQDHKGRFKPIHTLASEVLRKISRKNELYGYSAEQIFISLNIDPEAWESVPLIESGKHEGLLKKLNVSKGLVSYRSFFTDGGEYKLQDDIRKAQMTNPKDHSVYEKAIIKLDEKVNIANMAFNTRLLKLYPQQNDSSNTWLCPEDLLRVQYQDRKNGFQEFFFDKYKHSVEHSMASNDWTEPNALLNKLEQYQVALVPENLANSNKIKAEIFLNKINIFGKLRNYYGILGMLSLLLFIGLIFKEELHKYKITKYIFSLMLLCFIFHTIGLSLRWYVSGHAPWSNGYESMIYIAWTTVLAGLIFSYRSLGGLTATFILAATILLVAGMNWLDPEISPLVPVLKSYWLMIHVSLEAGSYGFLMLGAVIGMLNLLLFILITRKNKPRISRAIKELTLISEITLIGGLVMVSIGTYLGGVWANESWGRYWGWDAKETWALVTILVYAFILHMRFIPGLKSVFAYNFASLFGFATVIMTYYGVNYYLSGLHSYAAGDPVPIPTEVYKGIIVLIILSIVGFISYRKKYLKY
ncbi:MAG: cytochrome c biogenesis protein CcsA [Saprospiraceae bacterium]|nr:cytochrome c biogenesis protein CcsA [Saprospiraceae bacterium]